MAVAWVVGVWVPRAWWRILPQIAILEWTPNDKRLTFLHCAHLRAPYTSSIQLIFSKLCFFHVETHKVSISIGWWFHVLLHKPFHEEFHSALYLNGPWTGLKKGSKLENRTEYVLLTTEDGGCHRTYPILNAKKLRKRWKCLFLNFFSANRRARFAKVVGPSNGFIEWFGNNNGRPP